MALIPTRIKSMVTRWTTAERADFTLLNIGDAQRWEEARVEQAVTAEAIAPQLFSLATGDGEDPAFRRITSVATLRDLNPMMHDRMQQVCFFISVTTPFGKRIVEIITSYSVGKGVTVQAEDPEVQASIDRFWFDPINKMDTKVAEMCNELTVFGEICQPFARNEVDGSVRLGYVDPMNIDSVQYGEMATANGTSTIAIPFAVRLRRQLGEAAAKTLRMVRKVEDVNDPNYGYLDGECFYAAINKAKSASRGISELFALADWIDVFDQLVFDFADKVRMLNAFLWHYTIEGADGTKVEEFKNKLTKEPPKQGGVQVTNEKVKIEAQTPDFKGADMAQGAAFVKKYGIGGAGFSLTMFGDGEDSNRASALEMNAPTTKKIQDRQTVMATALTEILNYVIDSAVRAGVLRPTVNRKYTLKFPEVAVKDLVKGATTLSSVTVALSAAEEAGWIQGTTAARAFHTILAELGVEIGSSQEEYAAAQEEKKNRDIQRQESYLPQGKLATALQQLQSGGGAALAEGGEDDA